MLKQQKDFMLVNAKHQPPSGGCVLKQFLAFAVGNEFNQPPSGGCVLKPRFGRGGLPLLQPAAFGRLCVETYNLEYLFITITASRLRAAVC